MWRAPIQIALFVLAVGAIAFAAIVDRHTRHALAQLAVIMAIVWPIAWWIDRRKRRD